MGIKERKTREKENLRKHIVSTAQEILMNHGLDGLTMRAVANDIEYSQSKIYEFFASKDELYEELCGVNCEMLLKVLQKIPSDINKKKYLTDLVVKTIEFHSSIPHSDELLTLICFGPPRYKVPKAFQEIEKLFISALKDLKSPYLTTENDILSSLDIIRCIFIGVSKLMVSQIPLSGKVRGQEIAKNALEALLRGWEK